MSPQLAVPLIHSDVDGVEMGILDDGTPYLSTRGLAKLAGISHPLLSTWNYDPSAVSGRDASVRTLLRGHKESVDQLFVRIEVAGNRTNAYPDFVCMAILEYYAFESPKATNPTALQNFRVLARAGLRTFIYESLGYSKGVPAAWLDFQQRLTLNKVPPGYFSAFSEMHKLVLLAIQGGLILGPETVPDISIGRVWSNHWGKEDLAKTYGERTRYEHVYPDHYPQAAQNPYDAYAYPIKALGEFHTWFQGTYVPEHFPKYLKDKAKKGHISATQVTALIAVLRSNLMLDGPDGE